MIIAYNREITRGDGEGGKPATVTHRKIQVSIYPYG
jgi:hypothetical protein